jgi:hypothetical protein
MLHPETPSNVSMLKAAEDAAPSLKAEVTALGVHSQDEIMTWVIAFAAEPNRGLVIVPHAITMVNGNLIVELAARYGYLPSMDWLIMPRPVG